MPTPRPAAAAISPPIEVTALAAEPPADSMLPPKPPAEPAAPRQPAGQAAQVGAQVVGVAAGGPQLAADLLQLRDQRPVPGDFPEQGFVAGALELLRQRPDPVAGLVELPVQVRRTRVRLVQGRLGVAADPTEPVGDAVQGRGRRRSPGR
jgi:hypothetical protein